MFQLLRSVSKQDLAIRQLPAFTLSFLIAAFFYKFGSFALECLAFLATWAVIDLLIGLVTRRTNRPAAMASSSAQPPAASRTSRHRRQEG